MNILLLTDDYYLKKGVEFFALDNTSVKVTCLHMTLRTEHEYKFQLIKHYHSEGVVLVAIQDDKTRESVCRAISGLEQHVFFIFDVPGDHLPQPDAVVSFLPKKIKIQELLYFLQYRHLKMVLSGKPVFVDNSLMDTAFFNLITGDVRLSHISDTLGVGYKRLHVRRDKILRQYNLGTTGVAFRLNLLKKIVSSRRLINSRRTGTGNTGLQHFL